MDGTYRGNLHLWDDSIMLVVHDLPVSHGHRGVSGPHFPNEFAERLYECETLQPIPGFSGHETSEPYSLQWFLDIENHRLSRFGKWIPRLLEFAKHSGETLLGLGNGLGTDWLQYARHGASVVVCSPSAEQLSLIRRNFELRGLKGKFLHSRPNALPLEAASIDVACLSSLLHEVEDPESVVREVFRVLKPGGKVLAVTPARFDVDYWFHCVFPWQRWLSASSNPAPTVKFTSRALRQLFDSFADHRVHKRQLRRSEVPHVWRWIPLPILERMFGRCLVLKAFKPLKSLAVISLPEAA